MNRQLPHRRRVSVTIGWTDVPLFVVRGHPRSLNLRNKEKPMTALQAEKSEITDEDKNLAAVSEVEAGIRDFVRKDVAYLRRGPATPQGMHLQTRPQKPRSAASTR